MHNKKAIDQALRGIMDFRLRNPKRGAEHLECDFLAVQFLKAHDSGADVEQITQAAETLIRNGVGRFIGTTASREDKIRILKNAILRTIGSMNELAAQQVYKGNRSEMPNLTPIAQSLTEMCKVEFCPKSSLHHGLRRLKDTCGAVARKIQFRQEKGHSPESRL